MLLYPPVWHRALRTLLVWQASRQGCELSIGRVEGRLFGTTQLSEVHLWQWSLPPAPLSAVGSRPEGPGTNLTLARIELAFAWRVPFLQHPAAAWIKDLVLEGLNGQLDISTKGVPKGERQAAGFAPALFAESLLLSRRIVPGRFRVDCENLLVRRGRFWLHWRGGLLTGKSGDAGQFQAHEIGAGGPGYENTLIDRHAVTFWKDGKLTLANLELRPTVALRSVTLDGAHLGRRQLDWTGDLDALGGSVRGQGSLDFSRRRLGLDIACSLAGVQVRPLAKTLGIDGVTDGQVVQSNFTFRGDLDDWLGAEMWMSGRVTDFRWRQRRWESLDARAIVINRHLQVHGLELRQSQNHLSFNGECALPPSAAKPGAAEAAVPEDWWRQAAFSCNIDARLDDLQALSDLLSPQLPELQGRMSANGKITARGGEAHGFEGYLNVEGSALSIRQAPLDYLRATLLFHGDELQVADLQATQAGDYFTGKGTLTILGPFRYQGQLRASAKDLAVYAPAYQGVLSSQPVGGALTLEWSGDGTPAAHNGTFKAGMEHFFTSAGGVLPRPVSLETEGTYSPVSLSVRRLTLLDGEGKDRHEAVRAEGTFPWNQDPQQWTAGHWMDLTRPLATRVECAGTPLDVLAALVPGVVNAGRGQVSGMLEAKTVEGALLLDGALRFKDAGLLWTRPDEPPVEHVNAAVRIERSLLHVEECHGRRAGEEFDLQGTVDLRDPAHVILDLIGHGAATLQTADGRFKARAE